MFGLKVSHAEKLKTIEAGLLDRIGGAKKAPAKSKSKAVKPGKTPVKTGAKTKAKPKSEPKPAAKPKSKSGGAPVEAAE